MTTSVTKIEYIMYNVQDYSFIYKKHCSPGYMRGLAFYSHVENTCMTASVHCEVVFVPIKLV